MPASKPRFGTKSKRTDDTRDYRRAERERENQRRGSLQKPENGRQSWVNRENVILVREYDTILFATVIILLLFGLIMIFSSSYYVSLTSKAFGNNIFYFFARQASATVIGFLALLVAALVNYHTVCKFAPIMYLAACGCLVYVALFGEVINGAKRWIDLGFTSFQPSEFAKVSVVLMLALFLGKDPKRVNTIGGLFVCAVIIGIPAGLVYWGGNTSTLIILCAIGAGMIFMVSSYTLPWLALAGLAGGGFMAYLHFFAGGFHGGRYAAHRDPFSDPSRYGYQIIQGLYAVASGGLFGLGLGNSNQKLSFMPEPHNDFIFAVICEELGFFGAVLVLGLFGVFVWRGIQIALRAVDLTGTLIATGTTILVTLQVLINVAVVTNTIINTGIPLPFISYGGTSVAFILALTGVMLNVSRYSKQKTE